MSELMNNTISESTQIRERNLRNQVREKWAKIIAFASIIAIALGGINDTMDAVSKIYNITLSQFTDIPSHNKLARIYVRASQSVLNDTLGAPVYIKKSYTGDIIRYYKDKNFILSSVTRDDVIVAFLVFPLNDFLPDTEEHSGKQTLLTQYFSQNEFIDDVRVSSSPSISYYIEENPTGEFSNLYNSVTGYSEFLTPLTPHTKNLFYELADNFLMGENINKSVIELRTSIIPNFYGYTTEGLDILESAILTITEYKLIK